jgi:uncharacterized protein YecE (DUF72 family)
MGRILVGTSSWTDKSLLQSGWYPKGMTSAEDRLRFYASNFPIVEVDSTYYFPPSEQNSELWIERTPDNFVFNIKAFSLLTQHPTKADALYKDLPRPDTGKKNIYVSDLDGKTIDEVWDRFLSALWPLHAAGKLGALLFQFPPWFHISKRNRNYILECVRRAAPMVICVEFRNETWMTEDNRSETLDFLEGHGIPYVSVDMPQGFKSSIPPVAAATTDLAVFRFHGRNVAEWNSKSVQRRFRYDYSEEELSEWIPRIKRVAQRTDTTHVMMNNCYRDYAQQNANELSKLLRRESLAVVEPVPARANE